nr:MAG TPA: hypothetical protein [Caudoviricetes sp.]
MSQKEVAFIYACMQEYEEDKNNSYRKLEKIK